MATVTYEWEALAGYRTILCTLESGWDAATFVSYSTLIFMLYLNFITATAENQSCDIIGRHAASLMLELGAASSYRLAGWPTDTSITVSLKI